MHIPTGNHLVHAITSARAARSRPDARTRVADALYDTAPDLFDSSNMLAQGERGSQMCTARRNIHEAGGAGVCTGFPGGGPAGAGFGASGAVPSPSYVQRFGSGGSPQRERSAAQPTHFSPARQPGPPLHPQPLQATAASADSSTTITAITTRTPHLTFDTGRDRSNADSTSQTEMA